MPSVQGLSKAQANYRKAVSVGGCRYVRGVIHADDTCDEFKPRDAGS